MDVLLAIAGINHPPPDGMSESVRWAGVLASAMEPESQLEFLTDVLDKTQPVTPLGIFVLVNQMCHDSLGLDTFSASNLSSSLLGSWFLFAGWCASHGLHAPTMDIPTMLAAHYRQQLEMCNEEKDVHKLNRRIFGTKNPWGA